MFKYKSKAMILTSLFSLAMILPAFASPKIVLKMDSRKAVMSQGKEIFSDAKDAKPGDILIYTIKTTNTGDSAAYKVEPVGDIPKGTSYVPEKSISKDYKTEFSIDNGVTYQEIPKTTVVEKGKTLIKNAPFKMYNKVKWILKSVAPKKSILLTYRVKVK